MVNVNAAGFLARAALLGTTALTLFGAPSSIPLFGIPEAAARVGVTSATDGDPLGKPPTEAERVLRIGIDVQANELITTNARDRAHLVFLDGTSLTVGPNAQLTIDRFVFDPATKTGDLAITATKGVFRLVGGKISKTKPITIATPSATIGIRGGITIFNVQPASTTSTFVFGNGMTFTAGGQTQTVTRPGSQVTASAGQAAGPPTLVAPGGLTAALNQLEGGQSTGGGGGTGSSGGSADQKAQSSGFSSINSGQSPGALQGAINNPAPQPAAQRINNSNVVTNALSNVQTEQQDQQGIAERSTSGTTNSSSNNNNQPPPPPGSRTSQTLKGFVGGIVQREDGTTRPLGSASVPATIRIQTNASSDKASATIKAGQWDGYSTSARFRLGGTPTTSVFIDDNTYAMTDRPGADAARVKVYGTSSASSDVVPTTVLISNGVLAAGGFSVADFVVSQGFTPCTCEFLTWGVWLGQVGYGPNSPYNPNGTDSILATYVAGKFTSAVDLSALNMMNANATYTGNLVGTVQNGASTYAAAGSYTNNWSFGSQTGKAFVNFDGATFGSNITANTALTGGGPKFSTPTPLPSVTGPIGRNLTLNGAFVNAPGVPAKGQIGSFAVSGPSYTAGGAFAAQKP
jgi:hypothetical protein